MAPFYGKPENALKRAEELITVNQATNALMLLNDVILSKKSRTVPLPSLEPIVVKFVDLCVQLRKGKLAKDALIHYKNIAQNTSVSTIEHVIKHYIVQAEQQVTLAQSKANASALDQIEDLEAIETPESILLSTVSTEGQKDRTDREVVTPWLKFLWESYRTALDILRNNARLEVLYQMVANHAFSFCLKYQRKTEFRRLCELLRGHVTTAQRYSHQANMVNLNEPDTLQRHIDTRFVQLNAATDLELWNEAFRSIEDVQLLLSMSKKAPRPFMMANYYEKLAKIFLVADNYLFHSAAVNKYYATLRLNKTMSEEEHTRMASNVLVSILAIPIITTSNRLELDDQSRSARLTALLRSARAPTREALLKEALSKNLLARVTPEVRNLYNILEVQFHPLNICQKISPILSSLSSNAELSKYVEPLHQVILTRVLQQLSQVYGTVKMDFIVGLLALPKPFNYDAQAVEKFIMIGCRKGELSIRIDHATQTVTFVSDPFSSTKGTVSEGPSVSSLPSEQMRLQLVHLAKRLSAVLDVVDPPASPAALFKQAAKEMEAEREKVLERIRLIERKKEKRELDAQRRDEALQQATVQRRRMEAEAERTRIADEERRREADRITNQRKEIERAEAKKLAEKIAEDLRLKNSKIKLEELENLDTKKLMELQATTLEQEKRDFVSKLKATAKRFDHLERAFRKEEKQLLVEDYHNQKKKDLETHLALHKQAEVASKLQWEENVALKKTLAAILPDYNSLRAELEKKYALARAEAAEQAKKDMDKEKKKKQQEAQFRKAGERMRRVLDEENRRERAQEEQMRVEEEARMVEERRRREEEREKEYEERKRKLDEQAQKQAERERLAEEKIRATPAPVALAPAQLERKMEERPWRRDDTKTETPISRRAEPGERIVRQDSEQSGGSGGGRIWGNRMPRPSSQLDGRAPSPTGSRDGAQPSPAPASAPGKYKPPARRQDETGGWRK